MKIIVNDIAASSGGALTILNSFHKYLQISDKAKEHEWIFLLSDNYIEESDNIKVIICDDIKKNWLSRLKFEILGGRNFIAALNPDIVFSLQNTITSGVECPQVLYMHQSIPFQSIKNFSFLKSDERVLAVYQHIIGRLIKRSIKKADFTIVQTEWIREAVLKKTNISPVRIMNIMPPREDYSQFKRDDLFNNKSFFYPANKSIYKNHKCVIDAADILKNKGFTDFEVLLTTEKNESDDNFTSLGSIAFKKVLEQYNKSTLIFPSYIETIGLPLLEAREMGTIILASDTPFSIEVLDGYENAYFFDPFEPGKLAELMIRVIDGDIEKKSCKKLISNSDNSWQKIIRILLSFKEVIK